MLRFADACTKDGAVSVSVSAVMPHALRVLAYVRFWTARQKMVDGQVRPSDVTDIRIIDAMLAVPREAFFPKASGPGLSGPRSRCQRGRPAKRFLIKPVVLAKMLQAAEIKETDRVLVVGCATGYAAAVMARFAAQVTATESDQALAARRRRTWPEWLWKCDRPPRGAGRWRCGRSDTTSSC